MGVRKKETNDRSSLLVHGTPQTGEMLPQTSHDRLGIKVHPKSIGHFGIMIRAPKLRVFVSSQGDVAAKRIVAKQVLAQLTNRFESVDHIQPAFWEHERLECHDSFQS